jgi:hypothetical protein
MDNWPLRYPGTLPSGSFMRRAISTSAIFFTTRDAPGKRSAPVAWPAECKNLTASDPWNVLTGRFLAESYPGAGLR